MIKEGEEGRMEGGRGRGGGRREGGNERERGREREGERERERRRVEWKEGQKCEMVGI